MKKSFSASRHEVNKSLSPKRYHTNLGFISVPKGNETVDALNTLKQSIESNFNVLH
jgi:hypothetical protein